MSLTKVSYSMIEGSPFNILDYGADPTGATPSTSAIQAAIDAAGAAGGGVVIVPEGTYKISELTFGTNNNVILQGQSSGISYGNAKTTCVLNCVTGVYAIKFPDTSSYCQIRDLAIQSNGVVNTTLPYTISTPGVEYGVVIETGSTVMQDVTVYGFQYGCSIVNGGNSNIFNQCSFIWNTRVGFGCTPGNASAFALYHPNLTAPSVFLASTVWSMTDCVIRRNGWGVILRDGAPRCYGNLIESNLFGAVLCWVGSLDTGVSGNWVNTYLENNWISFSPTATTWYDAAIVGNSYCKNNTGTYIALTDNASNALSDFGYQITIGSGSSGTAAGPAYINFVFGGGTLTSDQKGVFIKQGLLNTFDNFGFSGGDQTNLIRLGYPSGGFQANATHIYNLNGTYPTSLSNRTMLVRSERTYSDGGLTATAGYYRGLAGNLVYPATPAPVTVTGTAYDARPFPEQSSFIVNPSGAFIIDFRPASETTYSGGGGRWLFIKTIAAQTVSSGSSDVVPITGGAAGTAILPATAGAWAMLQSDGTNWVIMAKG